MCEKRLCLGREGLRRGEQVVAQLGAGDVAQQHSLARIRDDREAAVRMRLENGTKRGDGVACGGEHDEVLDARHDLRRGDVGDLCELVVAIVKEGVFVEVNPGFVDAAAAKPVADPLGEHDGGHDGEDIGQRAGKLEHDDDNGDSHARDAGEGRSGADNGICARIDAGNIWSAVIHERSEGWVVGYPHLHDDAHSATGQSTDRHRGEDDACGYL